MVLAPLDIPLKCTNQTFDTCKYCDDLRTASDPTFRDEGFL